MGWRFRHSFKLIPGVKLNLSKRGLSCSIGGAPFTVNVGPRGMYGTASIPGTGISYRQQIGGGSQSQEPVPTPSFPAIPSASPSPEPQPTPIPTPIVGSAPIEEIRSSSTELLTSESLRELKRVIQTAYTERQDIERHLTSARLDHAEAHSRYSSWDRGFLLKRIFKKSFAQKKVALDTAEAKVAELGNQHQLTIVAASMEISKEQAEPYFRMRDEFASLSECAAIWDIKKHQATDRVRERTTAVRRVDREKIAFSLGACDLLQWDQRVPRLSNANGGDLFLFPGFILYRAAKEAFSVIDFHDVNMTGALVKFQEEEGVPKDSTIVGQTWAKANKNGTRDMRFVNNYEIPIVQYASLVLKSESGLWEEFQFSNPERLVRFVEAWKAFVQSFASA